MIEDLREMIKDEDIRKEVYKYLEAVQNLKTRGGEEEVHKVCYNLVEEFIRVNEEYDGESLFNIYKWKSHINARIKSDNTHYCITVDFEELVESSRTWKSIDVCIDKKTMLITTVLGIDEYILY